MEIEKILVGQLDVNCYVIWDAETAEALIIDPGDEPEKIIGFIDSKGLKPEYILFTHAHYDHICAVRELHERYRAVILMHKDEIPTYRMTARYCISLGYEPEDFPEPQKIVKDGDFIKLGRYRFDIMHTPGHTPGSICISVENILFTGDTLFRAAAGRTDLPGGDFRLLLQSLRRLMLLPAGTTVFCGHEASTTIGEEARINPFIKQIETL
jgi:hydroxyacylglutathione hydrolase